MADNLLKGSATHKPFVELGASVLVLLHYAKTGDRGQNLLLVPAVVLSAFQVEACLNHIGMLKLSCWESERHERMQWKDKLKLVSAAIGASVDLGKGHGASVVRAFEIRDLMAHGKTAEYEVTLPVSSLSPGSTLDVTGLRTPMARMVPDIETATRITEGCGAVVEELHSKAGVHPAELHIISSSGLH